MSTCGVGGWGGPLPGDPSNDVVLTATAAFGGIDLLWTYPATNPHAVAYVRIYRGLSASFAGAFHLVDRGGGFFHDRISTVTRYYYWIQIISSNGTPGTPVGPATAVAMPTRGAMIEELTAGIDRGLLSTALKGELDRIVTVDGALAGEIVSRQNGDTTLAAAMADANAGVAQALTFLASEQTSRVSGDSALAASVNLVAVTSGSNLAAAQATLNASIVAVDGRVTTLATTVTGVESAAASNLAAASASLSTSIATVDGKVTAIGALYTVKLTVNGLVGGFGVYNDGSSVEAGFDVDTFWIGKTAANKRKPFIINGGVVYINEAVIPILSADKIDTNGLTIRNAAGQIIFGAGSTVDPSNFLSVPAGWLNTNQQWVNVSGTGRPADGATVGKSLGLPFASWSLNGQSLVNLSDGKVGRSALRLAGNGGYPNQVIYVAIDHTKKYRTRFWARPMATTAGTLYFSLQQFTDAVGNTGPINGGRSPYKPSGVNRAIHNAQFGGTDQWGEYSYIWDSADWQAGVQFVRPDFLDNYPSQPGYWEVQDFTFEEVTEVVSAATTATWAGIPGGTGKAADNATVGATWNSNITGRPTDAALLNALQEWSEVQNAGGTRPANNATVGATWGVNLGSQPTALAGINSAEGTKLGGIAAGATANQSDVTTNNAIAGAATTSNWSGVSNNDGNRPANGATVGANASNFTGTVGGGNVLPNSGLTRDVNADGIPDGWGAYNSGGTGLTFTHELTGGPDGGPSARVGITVLGASAAVGWHQGNFPIALPQAGGPVVVSAFMAASTGPQMVLYVEFKNSAGGILGSASRPFAGDGNWQRYTATFTAPANTTQMYAYLWITGGSGAAAAFVIAKPQIEVGDVATSWKPAAADALMKGSDSILAATVSIDAITGAGFRAGNLTWNASGALTGGFGVAMTPGGLVGVNPAGQTTLNFNAVTGALMVKGDISGSTVNAVGGLGVNGATWANSATGFFTGIEGSNAVLRVGSPSGANLKFDGTNVSMVVRSNDITYLGIVKNMPLLVLSRHGGVGTSTIGVRYTSDGLIQSIGSNGTFLMDYWYSPQTANAGGAAGAPAFWIKATAAPGTDTVTGSALGTWLGLDNLRSWSVSATASVNSGTIERYTRLSITISSSPTGSPVIASGTVELTASATGNL